MLSFVFPWGVNHAAWLSSSPCPDYNRCPAGCSAHSWGTDDMRRWELHHGSSLPPNAREQKLSNSVITQLEGIYLLTEKNPKQKKTRNKIPKQFQISKKHSNNIQLDFINHNPQSKKKKNYWARNFRIFSQSHSCKSQSVHYLKVESVLLTFYLQLLHFPNSCLLPTPF